MNIYVTKILDINLKIPVICHVNYAGDMPKGSWTMGTKTKISQEIRTVHPSVGKLRHLRLSLSLSLSLSLCLTRPYILDNKRKIKERLIDLVGRVFTNGPGDLGSIQGRVIPKTFKMVLDTSLLNTQIRYVSRVKWSNPEKGVAPSRTPRCSSY